MARYPTPEMSFSTILFGFLVFSLFNASPAAAFGAGNIGKGHARFSMSIKLLMTYSIYIEDRRPQLAPWRCELLSLPFTM